MNQVPLPNEPVSPPQHPGQKPRLRRKRKYIIPVILVILTCSCFGLCLLSFQNRVGTAPTAQASGIKGIPADATDVKWFFAGAFGPTDCYSFQCSEEAFHQWAQNFPYRELTGPHRHDGGKHEYDLARLYEIDVENREIIIIEASKTISYSWSYTDQGVYLTYNLETGRAHFHSHSR